MARVIVSLLAQTDTAHILTDLRDKAGRAVSRAYAAAFEKLYERLMQHPDSGAPRPAIGKHVRIGVISPYVVIYEHIAADDTVMIMRIAHGRRKISRKFLRSA
ncbi:MAG: hypothetical protein FD139_839 [Methylocystaceae bacterium]|nr:MAG: hypothetical protein FD148_3004 [Methylocystaceae bacterium]KAF0207516.1 MAG: hypothetical protein FD172_3669 [Methylocystaceae bacterium]TXT46660.1 MAG: hypothetical protein FD139_839 [Methylocystaceae bacterium]